MRMFGCVHRRRAMTVVWLIVWLLAHVPEVAVFGPWNSWGVALMVCFGIDLLGVLRANASVRARARAGR
jgi:hypothetical protein